MQEFDSFEAKNTRPENESMQIPKIYMAVQSPPLGVRTRRWTLRNDNQCHHHGIVRLSE